VKFRSETGRFDGGTRARVTARLVYYCVHYGWHFSEVPVVACVLGMLNVLESSRSRVNALIRPESDLCKLEGPYLFVLETYRQKRVFPRLIQNN
jgi:hypothetical protein